MQLSLIQLYKRIGIVFILNIVLAVAAFDVAMGVVTLNIFPNRSVQYAEAKPLHASALPQANIAISKFSARPQEPFTTFKKGNVIEFFCTVATRHGVLLQSEQTFFAVIKSGTEEISRKQFIANDKSVQFDFEGKYTAASSGTQPFACRIDVENQITESNERDNREVLFLLIGD